MKHLLFLSLLALSACATSGSTESPKTSGHSICKENLGNRCERAEIQIGPW